MTFLEAPLTIFDSVKSLFSALSFLFTGWSFGCLKIPPYKITPQFMITYTRGCALLCLIIYIPIVTYSMQHNIQAQLTFATVILIWMFNIATIAFIDYKRNLWIFGHVGTLFLILIKLSISSFNVASECLKDELKLSFAFNSLMCELSLLLIYSPLPFALLEGLQQDLPQQRLLQQGNSNKCRKVGFTIWSLEISDTLSHIFVLITYCNHSDNTEWNIVAILYFIFWEINIFLWFIPSFITVKKRKLITTHIIISDVLTDIPMFFISLIRETYVGNIYIVIDMVVKALVFLRAIVWVPIQMWSEHDQGNHETAWKHHGYLYAKEDNDHEDNDENSCIQCMKGVVDKGMEFVDETCGMGLCAIITCIVIISIGWIINTVFFLDRM